MNYRLSQATASTDYQYVEVLKSIVVNGIKFIHSKEPFKRSTDLINFDTVLSIRSSVGVVNVVHHACTQCHCQSLAKNGSDTPLWLIMAYRKVYSRWSNVDVFLVIESIYSSNHSGIISTVIASSKGVSHQLEYFGLTVLLNRCQYRFMAHSRTNNLPSSLLVHASGTVGDLLVR